MKNYKMESYSEVEFFVNLILQMRKRRKKWVEIFPKGKGSFSYN